MKQISVFYGMQTGDDYCRTFTSKTAAMRFIRECGDMLTWYEVR